MGFDRSRLILKALSERVSDLGVEAILPLGETSTFEPVPEIARRIECARERGSAVIMLAGGHVVRAGVQRYLIDLLEKGYISCLAMNGSCVIHDFELALLGVTTESVARYIREGQFGLWKETSRINDLVNQACRDDLPGFGMAVGKAISEGDFKYKEASILAACHRLGIPATVHVGIGYDIIHEHPNFDGAATGEMSYRDFLTLAEVVSRLEGGVVMNVGTAVMGPEVFLKALSMARNVAHQEGRFIRNFCTAVFDLHTLPESFTAEAPKSDPGYYFRPWKTLLVRTVADGGECFYVRGAHRETIPALWSALRRGKGHEDSGS